jgi:carbon monoxide dehydrogenase subunit G
VLTDLERIAPCLPGAQLQEIEGEFYRGVVKVKLGPISTAFKGQAQFLERDDAGHRAVLRGEGRDTGGKGNADALITAELQSLTATTTKCVVTTELRVTGKVAQFGRGIMGDISEKLMTQFANNLNTMLDADQTPAVEATTEPAVSESVSGEAPAPAPAVRTVNGPEVAPLELSGLAGGAVLKRVIPLLAVIAAIVVAAVLIWG